MTGGVTVVDWEGGWGPSDIMASLTEGRLVVGVCVGGVCRVEKTHLTGVGTGDHGAAKS